MALFALFSFKRFCYLSQAFFESYESLKIKFSQNIRMNLRHEKYKN